MARFLASTVIGLGLFASAVAVAGEPFVTRNPSGPRAYDIFENNRRIGTIHPDALGKPRVEGVSPAEQSRYTIQRSPSAADAYDILRDGKRIGSVISPPPSRPESPAMPHPSEDRLDLPGADREELDLDRPVPWMDRR